jgi:hypothetical protein
MSIPSLDDLRFLITLQLTVDKLNYCVTPARQMSSTFKAPWSSSSVCQALCISCWKEGKAGKFLGIHGSPYTWLQFPSSPLSGTVWVRAELHSSVLLHPCEAQSPGKCLLFHRCSKFQQVGKATSSERTIIVGEGQAFIHADTLLTL